MKLSESTVTFLKNYATINQSLEFLLLEYQRLNNKNKKGRINKVEKDTLLKLKKFLGKNK